MQVEIVHRPGNAAAKISLGAGEVCTAEAGAMIAMSAHIHLTTSTHKRGTGGLLKAAKRVLAGESFFLNHFHCTEPEGDVWLASTLSGDLLARELSDRGLIVQAGSYLASEKTVDMEIGWQGFKSMISGESMFWLNLSGHGKVVLSSFGAIYPVEVNGESMVDTGHIVAFDEGLSFNLTKAGKSWVSSFLGGEGLVCKFAGQGTVWCQSHNPPGFGRMLGSLLRPR